jgi:cell division transport system permease protein
MPEIAALQDVKEFSIFFAGILVLGILLSAFSTLFAVNKFLRMKIDNLYSN